MGGDAEGRGGSSSGINQYVILFPVGLIPFLIPHCPLNIHFVTASPAQRERPIIHISDSNGKIDR